MLNIVLYQYCVDSIPFDFCSQGLLVACLLGLLQSMNETHYHKLWELHHLHGTTTSSHQLHHLVYNFIVLLSYLVGQVKPVFSTDWFFMHTVTNSIVLTAMQEIAKPVSQYFTSGSQFDYQVRKMGGCVLVFVTVAQWCS